MACQFCMLLVYIVFICFFDNLNSHNDNVEICLFDNMFVFLTISR